MMREIRRNFTKAMLQANELVLCMAVNQMRTPNIGMIAASAGFDAIYVDLEHNPTDLQTTAAICIGALAVDITPIVRIASCEPQDVSRVLDLGAQGVMVAHVNTAEEARAIVDAALFKPKGRRSASGTLPSLGYRRMPQGEINRLVNQETLVIPIIETEEGLANVEAIAAVDGIDTLHIGANDLSVEMGLPGQVKHPRMREAYAKVAAAARTYGRSMGVGGARNEPELQAELLKLGVRYLTCGADVGYVIDGGRADSTAIRAMSLR
ncbi:MAG: aldolase/citrate lyase family protein [Chthoniobacter sp.]|nr:aldolase/citrate lyase family protein [Chthoniobacter sp.]